MSYLLDTNVVSEVRKGRGSDDGVLAWFSSVRSTDLYLSVLVVGEIRQGIERLRRRGDDRQADVFEAWLTELHRDFADRLVPVTSLIAEQWGRMNVPNPLPTVDGLLAASAAVNGMTLVTRNTAHIAGSGARVFNPFSSTSSSQ